MPKMSGYVETFKVKDGEKKKNNKLMSFRRDDEKLLDKYKAIWTKTEDLRNIESLTIISIDFLFSFKSKCYL